MRPRTTSDDRCEPGVEPLLMSIRDLQRFIGVGKTSIFSLVARGEIETVKVGRRTLAVTASAKAYVERLRQARRPTETAPMLAEAS